MVNVAKYMPDIYPMGNYDKAHHISSTMKVFQYENCLLLHQPEVKLFGWRIHAKVLQSASLNGEVMWHDMYRCIHGCMKTWVTTTHTTWKIAIFNISKPCNPFQQNSKNFSGETHRLSEYSWKAHHPTTVLAPLYKPPPLLLRFGASMLRNKDFHMSNEQRAPDCWGYIRGYTTLCYGVYYIAAGVFWVCFLVSSHTEPQFRWQWMSRGCTLQGANISHLGKTKNIDSKMPAEKIGIGFV